MDDNTKILEELNARIGLEESKGDLASREWFEKILAPQLAFMRADGKTFDDRDKFIGKIKPGTPRETVIISVELYGNRAIAECIVTMKIDGEAKNFHNLRMFVRHEGEWKLMGWANEPM